MFRYQVDFGSGERNVVSLLDPEWVYEHGLGPEAVIAVLRGGAEADVVSPADVQENGPFLRVLSRAIFEHADRCDLLRREAEIQGSGYVYLLDGRTPTPGGRVPPEDIIGVFEARDGALVAGSYQHNPRHRLFTNAGWFRLPAEIEDALQARLRSVTW
ncbi:hypothetical protein [Asanoa iriomotensis]|uniref:hypothetical protein n=1 Tax=Asanoa iriomotensis TaxID=234613 RepID=UPI0019440F55|nr:hypothetical protein [Asanoa iriomotensis]